ncbi:KaiC domain-containing protein [Halobacterium noricense]|nr:KaiC domain-containing protein [Halobacterium noricense]UHH24879.1 KaiC domain-containing protein [Halobacterium noricense]
MADEEDEDWFEKAFEEETEAESEAEPEEEPSGSESGEPSEAFSEAPEEPSEPPEEFGEASSEPPTPAEPEDEAEPGPESEVDEFAEAFGGGADGEPTGGEEDLFEDDFAAAFGGGGGGGPGAAPSGGEDDFGFDLDADVGAGGPGGFEEDEEYESDIARIDFGIEGLDEMVQGGVPERSLIVAIGGAGTGKTTFGLQFLHEAIQNGERAVYITLEESRQRVVQSATEKGWEFDRHTEEGNLAVVDIDPIEMANSLTSIRNELPRLVEEFGASRLVLDSVSLLEMMYDDQSVRRTEIYDFTKALKDAGVTTMLTSEASEDNPFASRHGIIEYLTDAVVVLRYIRPEDFRETRLAVEIQKIRDANHSRETKPYEITHQGISVYRQANIF